VSRFYFILWIYTQSVGLLGRVIGPSQGLYLNTGHTNTEKRTETPNIHARSGIRTHDQSVRTSEDSSWLRPLGYRDRPNIYWLSQISIFVKIHLAALKFFFMLHWGIGKRSSCVKCSAGLWIIIKSKAFSAHKHHTCRRVGGEKAKFHCSYISEMDGSVSFWDRLTSAERSPNAHMGDRGISTAIWKWRRKQKSVLLTGIEPGSSNSQPVTSDLAMRSSNITFPTE
jgi:hypothetical protein